MPVDPSSKACIKAWIKVLICLSGYWAVLEVVQSCVVRRLVSPREAVSFLLMFTIAMLFLALVRTTVEQSRKTLTKAWLRTLFSMIGYFLVFGAVKMCESNHTISPNHALAFLVVFTFAMLFLALVMVFKPYRTGYKVIVR
jgi:hypothetical protein